jgi:hypothetical protein
MRRKVRLRREARAAVERRLDQEAETTLKSVDLIWLGLAVAAFAIGAVAKIITCWGIGFIALSALFVQVTVRCHRAGILRETRRRGFLFVRRSETVFICRDEKPVQYYIGQTLIVAVSMALFVGGVYVCIRGFLG